MERDALGLVLDGAGGAFGAGAVDGVAPEGSDEASSSADVSGTLARRSSGSAWSRVGVLYEKRPPAKPAAASTVATAAATAIVMRRLSRGARSGGVGGVGSVCSGSAGSGWAGSGRAGSAVSSSKSRTSAESGRVVVDATGMAMVGTSSGCRAVDGGASAGVASRSPLSST
ncbi:hypothetical protein [Streptomyces sp. KM273126]|uniref:hypothetical protein n=1 Tax=Streptomyces sp. KM273126 TaxID=2545247 RepID=UPI002868107D|nr:hypothetical protein [Streptomyces sp. KM273126]